MTKEKNTKAMQNGFLKKEIKYIRPHLSWCSNIMTSRIRTTAPITDQMTDHTDIEPPITFESEKINERNTLGQWVFSDRMCTLIKKTLIWYVFIVI